MYKRSTVLFSGLDATLTKTGRLADGGSRFFSFFRNARRRGDEVLRSTILRDRTAAKTSVIVQSVEGMTLRSTITSVVA